MRRLAAFLLFAGMTQIPVWAGDYFMVARPIPPVEEAPVKTTTSKLRDFFTSEYAPVKVAPPKPADSKSATKAVAKKPEPKLETKATKVVDPKKGVVQTSGVVTASPPKKSVVQASGVVTTSPPMTRAEFLTGSTQPVQVSEPKKSIVASKPLAAVSVYAAPPPPVIVPQAASTLSPKTLRTAKLGAPTSATVAVIPTIPMVPTPVATSVRPIEATETVVLPLPVGRVISPIRHADYTPHVSSHTAAGAATMPLPTGFTLIGGEMPTPAYATAPPSSSSCGSAACSSGPREKSGLFSGRLCTWAFYQPTTRGALPILQPLPCVGPILAFRCDSGGCAGGGCTSGGCAAGGKSGGGCATGNGNGGSGCAGTGTGLAARFGLGGAGHGCRNGCTPPPDNVFPGYKFASTGSPTHWTGPLQTDSSYSSYKPAVQQTGAQQLAPMASVDASPKFYKPVYATDSVAKPTSGDVLTRPFTRP